MWLKSSTTEPQQLKYFKLVFLILLNVPIRTVFAETVTYVFVLLAVKFWLKWLFSEAGPNTYIQQYNYVHVLISHTKHTKGKMIPHWFYWNRWWLLLWNCNHIYTQHKITMNWGQHLGEIINQDTCCYQHPPHPISMFILAQNWSINSYKIFNNPPKSGINASLG